MPLPLRSAIPSIRGIPAGLAVLFAVGCTFLGFLVDVVASDDLTRAFSLLYVLGCVGAVLAVRHRGLFSAMVQPPLILFVAVPLASQYFSKSGGTSVKDLLLDVAIPLVNRFPLMLTATLIVLAIGAFRLLTVREVPRPASRSMRTPPPNRVAPKQASPAPPRKPQPELRRQVDPRRHPSERRTPPEVRKQPPIDRPIRKTPPPPEPPRRSTPPRSRTEVPVRSEVPAHPVPNVRYRDRYESR